MRKLALVVASVALLGACTTQSSEAPATIEATPTSVASTAPTDAPTTVPDTTTQPPSPTTTTAATATTTVPAVTNTPQPTTTTTQPAPDGPVLIDPAYIPNVTVTYMGGGGPVVIQVPDGVTQIPITLDAESDVAIAFSAWGWYVDGGFDSLSFGNPTSQDFTLDIALNQDGVAYTISATAYNQGFGSDSIEIALTRLSPTPP